MFSQQVPPELKIPLLNKPPATPQSVDEKTSKYINDLLNQQNNGAASTSASEATEHERPRKFVPPSEYEDYVEFVLFEHFIISKLSIREICSGAGGDGCDVHIHFKKGMPALPQTGVSCLSPDNLWKDQAGLQGKKAAPAKLPFVKLVPYKHGCSEQKEVAWAGFRPRKGEVLTISLDISSKMGIKIRYSFTDGNTTNWFSVPYPPMIRDYWLLIGIEKSSLLECSYSDGRAVFSGRLDVLTSSGWLKLMCEKKADRPQEETKEQQKQQEPTSSISDAQLRGTEIGDTECLICLDAGSNVLFHPCGHYLVHIQCLVEKGIVDGYGKQGVSPGQSNVKCYKCGYKCEELLPLTFVENSCCYFCKKLGNNQCQLFDSYCYPCGCSLGCFQGFKQFMEETIEVMSLECPNPNCGLTLQNIIPFFRA